MFKTLNLFSRRLPTLYKFVYFSMDSEVSRAVSLYKKITKTPSVVSAQILPALSNNDMIVQSTWSSQDFVKVERSKFSRYHTIEKSNLNVLSTGICTDVSSTILSAVSKTGNKQAVLIEKKSPDETFIEIWNLSRKEATFALTDSKEHGKIVGKDEFDGFQWSSNEKYLLYTAEKKQPKGVSFFKETEKKDDEEVPGKGEEFLYREEWGEGFAGCHHSVLCVLEIATGKIKVLPTDSLFETEVSIGQANWGPNDESIVFVAWEELPYRLGIWACHNRRSFLCSFNLNTEELEFIRKEENTCVFSPRFSPNFDALVFLENESDGPHKQGSKLQKIKWGTRKLSTVVDVIKNPVGDGFPGIYTSDFPTRCWSADGNHVIFQTAWRSQMAAISVNVNNGCVKRIDEDPFGCFTVLDVHDNFVVAAASSPNIEPCLLVGCLNEEGLVENWKFLDEHTPCIHSDVKWKIHTLSPDKKADNSNYDYEIIVVSPADVKNNSLIVFPHGGPHSLYPAFFDCKLVSFIKLGYIFCIVNYRGSIGFGEGNLNSLPGNIGTQDVADVQNAAVYVKEKCNFDIGDVFVYGGSHGGFLGAHLIGQFPEFYKAAVLRNPVIDISVMVSLSDIPDWSWVEGGCGTRMDLKSVVKPEHLNAMWEVSPIKHAEKVITPTLLMLGKKDVRVPMAQAMLYYKILKARNVPVKVFQYDDNHVLRKTPVDGDNFIQAVIWLKKYSSS